MLERILQLEKISRLSSRALIEVRVPEDRCCRKFLQIRKERTRLGNPAPDLVGFSCGAGCWR